MPKLPRASGDRHVSAFKAAGWQVNHIEGSHYILIKNDSEIHLSIPVHKNKTLGVGLLKKLINKAGLTNEEYLEYFYGK
ncbi:MAG: addiction module toxin, HicA family [ANME-2 cluster archaeon]|jgi:predicted RNA binding protein YcfA (HicA-like mRNA interferase family)|nr:MAG: putative RNA binding protein YcfA, dsRBD-like fold [ANME-2 cluster archaeon]MRG76997.1 addiction module toxin, HicA family [ANME-2 cluster archaeon]